jgi:hypothetical protein
MKYDLQAVIKHLKAMMALVISINNYIIKLWSQHTNTSTIDTTWNF